MRSARILVAPALALCAAATEECSIRFAEPLFGDGATCEGNAWQAASFEVPADALSCSGRQLVRFDEAQQLHVGVTLCDGDFLRIYLSADGERFLPATDWAGHGQDHCELVNPSFVLLNEDTIQAACPTCDTSYNLPLEFVPVFARGNLGEQFELVAETPEWSYQTSRLACGVSLAACLGEAPPAAPAGVASNDDCDSEAGYELIQLAGAGGTPEVHVLSVYETRGDHTAGFHPVGAGRVRVERTAPITLVLSSYEPTAWTIELAPGASVERVVVNGYHESTVAIDGGDVPVVDRTGVDDMLSACGYGDDEGGCDTPALLAGAEAITGAPMTTFAGCYHATTFSVRDAPGGALE